MADEISGPLRRPDERVGAAGVEAADGATDQPESYQSAPAFSPELVLVAVSGSRGSEALVLAAKRLADALDAPWEAIHVETPEGAREGPAASGVAEALALAARNGATVATIPSATVTEGIISHLESSPASHLVLGRSRARGVARFWRSSTLDTLASRTEGLALHVLPRSPSKNEVRPGSPSPARGPATNRARGYAYAAALVGATLMVAELLQQFTGPRSLDLLFLFPVIAVAARLGLRAALLATALSVISYNYFLLVPAFSFDPHAPQNLVMTAVLIAVAVYTSALTTRMRGRIRLSDRSARENASLAALAQRLTRDADWEATALTICEHVHSLLKVNAIVLREVEGELAVAAAVPKAAELGPLDRAALEWTWSTGEAAGAGTGALATADWQFQPLKTSLGVLAVLALARDDGRNPIPPDRQILLSTIIAQASLAHERLRLESIMRAASTSAGP